MNPSGSLRHTLQQHLAGLLGVSVRLQCPVRAANRNYQSHTDDIVASLTSPTKRQTTTLQHLVYDAHPYIQENAIFRTPPFIQAFNPPSTQSGGYPVCPGDSRPDGHGNNQETGSFSNRHNGGTETTPSTSAFDNQIDGPNNPRLPAYDR